ncbi:hypothetical protein H8958_018173, partial [Nasalis larvatus]
LQQQITRLHQELGRQESLWADVPRKLQNHIDALRKQNLELREELRGLQRQQWKARKKPGARPHAGRESHTLAWEPAFGKISPLSVDEETMPKYVGRKSQSATVLGQRSSSNSLTPPKPMSLKTERINLGTIPPQEDREKGPPGRHQDGNPSPTRRPTPSAEKRGVSEDGKVMHPSSQSPQNSSGRKSAVQASQATTLQEQMAAAGGAGRGCKMPGRGAFLRLILQCSWRPRETRIMLFLQNLPVNPPPSLETAQPMDTKMKKEEVQEEKRHPNGKADDGRWSSFPESISRSSACCSLQTGHGS